MVKLTARQQQVFDFIKSYLDDNGMPPTRAEIAAQLGFRSPNAAEEHLKALARKGAIEMIPGASRGIRLPEDLDAGLPVVGSVAAGSPILAAEHIENRVNFPENFFYPKADYLLRVKGVSMKNIGILEDDLIAVHKTDQVKNGDVIVARINDDVTVKRFYKNRNTVTLVAENEDYDDIVVDLKSDDFAIEGLYVGVLRNTIH
ncbi:transcriptional repressor LexA [Gynuella sunshinyii]|uniref:LexA repressor n=1 Tax=Gynuella sunshinyii YC6258 TaxID=1445510 RepID=A0A0C5VPS3_9GAMM|nr:transcriptional repressor LexA [Gynuella sunshinyii]AJQ95433.1 SOS-response transcriptional repressors (RecA-mediated autopeptidase) [Gynuella sunshinyii YC6258]